MYFQTVPTPCYLPFQSFRSSPKAVVGQSRGRNDSIAFDVYMWLL